VELLVKKSQSLLVIPPSTWYDEVAAPHRNSRGKSGRLASGSPSSPVRTVAVASPMNALTTAHPRYATSAHSTQTLLEIHVHATHTRFEIHVHDTQTMFEIQVQATQAMLEIQTENRQIHENQGLHDWHEL
jgi:hypothetical protein